MAKKKTKKYDGGTIKTGQRLACKSNPGGMKKAPAGGGKKASGSSKMW